MSSLQANERVQLLQRFGKRVEVGDVLYAEGDAAQDCFLVDDGRIRLVKRIRATERSLTVLRPGELFGEEALLPHACRRATAVALSEASVLCLARDTFWALIQRHSTVAQRIITQLTQRLQDSEEQLENAMLRDRPSRVVNTLLRLVAAASRHTDGHVIDISPLELSSRVALSVEEVKRTVQQLCDGGYVRLEGERIIVPKVEALRKLYRLLEMKEGVREGDTP
ncbi:MAG: Crp/Fnr family transcriptional regulator [Polyangiales bacterium]